MKNTFRSALCVLAFSQIAFAADDRAEIIANVKTIASPGSPGAICVFGPNAFPIVVGQENNGIQLPVIAAGRIGKGRVVLFGHSGYLERDILEKQDTGTLLLNTINWAAAKKDGRVGVLGNGKLLEFLKKKGVSSSELLKNWHEQLKQCDVVLMAGEAPASDEQRSALKLFVEAGGGVLAASTPWGWAQTHAGKSLKADHPGNKLFIEAGLVFADGMPNKTSSDGYDVGIVPSDNVNASTALTFLTTAHDPKEKGVKKLLAQSSQSVLHALRSLPDDEKSLVPRIDALTRDKANTALPTPQKPLKEMENAVERLVLTKQLLEIARTPAEKIAAHPAAQFFPGAVPAEAKRGSAEVEINTKIPDWNSTGLYAAPGEKLTVTIPENATDAKLSVRIGCHSDQLWHLDVWRRAPTITNTFPLKQPKTTVANAFGGPIYIVVPHDCKLGTIKVSIENAVEAPRYIFGKTTAEEWKTIRERPAPWAEMECPRVVFSIPSEFIRTLDDPTPVMQFWVNFMDGTADLAAIPRERPRPERYVADTQISAGFMHSGYPIMMHYNEGKPCMDLNHLMTKDEPTWGYFHEMGHNHQQGDWTFGGTTEVTCNLFARYAFENLCKRPISDQRGHKNGEFAKNLRRYLAGGADFDKWKSDPFLALYMYDQLLMGFGWDTYKKVFAEYRTLSKDQRPKNDDEKHDQWMVRFSKAAGKNLGPFFEKWGVPTSEAARKSVADLPVWFPSDWPDVNKN